MEGDNMTDKVKFDKKIGTRIYNSNGILRGSFTENYIDLSFTLINPPFDKEYIHVVVDKKVIQKLFNTGYSMDKDLNNFIEFGINNNKQIQITIFKFQENGFNNLKGQKYLFYIDYYNFMCKYARHNKFSMLCNQRNWKKANKPVIKWYGINMVKLKQENKTQYNQLIKKLKDFTTWEAISIDLYNHWNHGDVYFVIRHHSRLIGLEGGIIWHRDPSKKAGGYYSMHT
jgi:hypothetical protein